MSASLVRNLKWLRTVALTTSIVCVLIAAKPAAADPSDPDTETAGSSATTDSDGQFLKGLFSSDEPAIVDFERPSDGYGDLMAKRNWSLMLQRSRGYGLLELPEVEEYLNSVLAQILAANGFGDLAPRVYIHADRAFNAICAPDGGIYINLGMLAQLEFEDELAFLLAHEVAHFLYTHHKSDWYVNSQHKLLASAEKLKEVSTELKRFTGGVGGELEKKTQKATQIGAVIYDLSSVVVHPAYGREQEEEADMLGLDLMVAAGFNPAFAEDVLYDLGAYEEEIRAKAGAAGGDLGLRSLEAFGLTDTGITNNSFFQEISKGIGQAVSEISSDHYPAEERIDAVLAYLDKHHPERPDTAPRPLPWTENPHHPITEINAKYQVAERAKAALDAGELNSAVKLAREAVTGIAKNHAYTRLVFFEIRRKQAQEKNARLNLKYALDGGAHSLAVYESLLDLEQVNRNWPRVLELIDEVKRTVGDAPNLLPHKIFTYSRMGERLKAEELRTTCKFDYPEIEKTCDAAKRGVRPKEPST